MRLKPIINILLMLIFCETLYSQITVRESEIVERPVFKPKQFDSLSDFCIQKKVIDYKKYIGYKLYYTPISKKYSPKYSDDKNERPINFLFTEDSIQLIKSGKIPFETTIITTMFGDPNKLEGPALKQYLEKKEKYEDVDKVKTNVYLPLFKHTKTDPIDGRILGDINSNPDSIYGKYFTIVDIKGMNKYYDKTFKKLEDLDFNDDYHLLKLKVILRNETNNDLLYWVVSAYDIGTSPFFLVPYYEKISKQFLNQNFKLKYKDRTIEELQNLIDINSGEVISMKPDDIWTCTEISFIDSKDTYYKQCCFFLKNGEHEIKVSLLSGWIDKYFILESEFNRLEDEKKKKEEIRKLEEIEKLKQEQLARTKFKNECISKWGQKSGSYIADGKVMIGMTKEMCTYAWGTPIDINRTITKGSISEQWVYGWGTYLYFENNILNSIQD